MGRGDRQGRRELPDLRRDGARRGDPLAGAPEGRRRRRQRRARPARQAQGPEHREGGRRDRRRQARRPVPDRRLPDRLGHLDEHQRQRGDRAAGRGGRAPQRPRQHGPVLQRRVPLRRAPRRARRRPERAAARAQAARTLLRPQGEELPERRQGGAHPPDGRRARDPRPGVRRLRRPDRPRQRARAGGARARRPDPARRHRHRHRPEHPPEIRREGPRAAEQGIRPETDRRAARPLRGAGQPRRAGRALRCAEGHRRVADEDRRRPRADGLRSARRHRRAVPARAAEGLLDHARQGQPGDPRGRPAGRPRR